MSIVLLTRTGPRCISFRCKITVSLAQGAVNDAEADVADPVFVRSTITHWDCMGSPPCCPRQHRLTSKQAHRVALDRVENRMLSAEVPRHFCSDIKLLHHSLF